MLSSTSLAQTKSNIKKIEKGELFLAPDLGYYLTQPDYQEMLDQALKSNISQDRLDLCYDAKMEDYEEVDRPSWFFGGVAAGLLGALFLIGK